MSIIHDPIVIGFLFIFGLIVGSFLNVCISRFPLKQSIITPRSHCPNCKTLIHWYHNIPLFSFLYLKGKCYNCMQKISIRYPLVEISTALLFLLVLYKDASLIAWPFHFYFLSALLISTCTDLEHWMIPDKITLTGMPIGILGAILVPEQNVFDNLAGLVIGGGSLLFVAYLYEKLKDREGIGFGDIKFMGLTGAFLGLKSVVLTLVIGSITGSIVGIALMLIFKKGSETKIKFGPFLAFGALISYLFGNEIWTWYLGLSHPRF